MLAAFLSSFFPFFSLSLWKKKAPFDFPHFSHAKKIGAFLFDRCRKRGGEEKEKLINLRESRCCSSMKTIQRGGKGGRGWHMEEEKKNKNMWARRALPPPPPPPPLLLPLLSKRWDDRLAPLIARRRLLLAWRHCCRCCKNLSLFFTQTQGGTMRSKKKKLSWCSLSLSRPPLETPLLPPPPLPPKKFLMLPSGVF